MESSDFNRDFKQLGSVYITDKVILLRKPLALYNLTTNTVIASFGSLDEALNYELNGKTLEKHIRSWEAIVFPVEFGGRGGGSGMGFSGGWPSAGGSGKDYNDTVNKWLKANQKKYGYTYSYKKA